MLFLVVVSKYIFIEMYVMLLFSLFVFFLLTRADLVGRGGGGGAQAPFFGFFYIIFVTNPLSSSGIVQSAQGCSCVVGKMQRCALGKIFQPPFSEFSVSIPD